ncbi:MAG: DUF6261 family protein [Puniceicoccales bacterium]|nr:DUF6261 family protein [Puniceicoccales bacterium]
MSGLRNEEHLGFHSEFAKLVNEHDLSQAFQDLVAVYNGHYDDLDVAVEIIRRSVYTGQMIAADRQRNATYQRLRDAVRGFTRHADSAKRLAATKLHNVVRHYGNLIRMSRDKKTYAMMSMLQDLRSEAADLQTLGLATWVGELEADNGEYIKLKGLRYDQWEQQHVRKVLECRAVLDADYEAIVQYAGAYQVLNPEDANVPALISALNERVDAYNRLIAQRRGIRAGRRQALAEASSSSSSSSGS